MKAKIKDIELEIEVRKMDKDEMPDNGIVYYCNDETSCIYTEDELELLATPPHDNKTEKKCCSGKTGTRSNGITSEKICWDCNKPLQWVERECNMSKYIGNQSLDAVLAIIRDKKK